MLSIKVFYLFAVLSVYLLKSHHVYEGFIEQNIFATKTPRHEVKCKETLFLCVLVPLWQIFPFYPGWV